MSVRDDGETTGLFEPLLVSESSRHRARLADLALELATRSEGFRRSLPSSLAKGLADLVRSMNCYYSNLIEGHDTHPVDIERALNNDYSADPEIRASRKGSTVSSTMAFSRGTEMMPKL